MNKAAVVGLVLALFASGPVRAEASVQIRVSATILPRPCEYPDRCEPVPAETQSKVIVEEEVVRYVGSPPEVSKKDGLMTVNF
jgi:type 1 fimbria pilin